MTSPFIQPDNEAQSGAHYKNNIDNGFAVMARLAAAFHVQAQDVPDLTVRCLGGPLWNGAALTEIAATNSPSFTAPVTNPRIDRVVLNPVDGSIQIVAGTEDADPSPPPVPGGMLPLAAVTLSPAQEEIVNADIKDERIAGGGVARINYNGDGPPTVDDDITQGYTQNSAWYDMTSTPREKYVCTDPAPGEADWQKATLTLDELVPLFATAAQGALVVALKESLKGRILNGLIVSNNADDAVNDIDIAPGAAVSDDGSTLIILSSSLTKRLDASFAEGDGEGGLDSGSVADGVYYVWLISKDNGADPSILYSLSDTSPTMPSSFTKKCLLGPIIRNGGAILPFTQDSDTILLDAPISLYDAAVTTSETTITVGLKRLECIFTFRLVSSNSNATYALFGSSDKSIPMPTGSAAHLSWNGPNNNQCYNTQTLTVFTGSDGDIKYKASAAVGSMIVRLAGWRVRR
jgi:hypothetical protein